MDEERTQGCLQSAAGPIGPAAAEQNTGTAEKGVVKMQVMVGKPAPDFEATAYLERRLRHPQALRASTASG